jgi:hypothetical protein
VLPLFKSIEDKFGVDYFGKECQENVARLKAIHSQQAN